MNATLSWECFRNADQKPRPTLVNQFRTQGQTKYHIIYALNLQDNFLCFSCKRGGDKGWRTRQQNFRATPQTSPVAWPVRQHGFTTDPSQHYNSIQVRALVQPQIWVWMQLQDERHHQDSGLRLTPLWRHQQTLPRILPLRRREGNGCYHSTLDAAHFRAGPARERQYPASTWGWGVQAADARAWRQKRETRQQWRNDANCTHWQLTQCEFYVTRCCECAVRSGGAAWREGGETEGEGEASAVHGMERSRLRSCHRKKQESFLHDVKPPWFGTNSKEKQTHMYVYMKRHVWVIFTIALYYNSTNN